MKQQNILVLTYWSFKEGLIQTYTLPYLRQIAKHISEDSLIHLVTFEKDTHRINESERTKHRLNLENDKINWKPLEYAPPGLRSYYSHLIRIFTLAIFIIKNRIHTIHTFCTPPGSLGYLLSILTGRKLILDSFEPHADNMEEIGHWEKSGLKYKILHWLENRQIRKASRVILTTQGMYEYTRDVYNFNLDKSISFVKPACVKLDLFTPLEDRFRQQKRKELGIDQNIVAVYAGKLGGIYHEQEVFDYLKCCYDYWDGKFSFLMLTNTPRKKIDRLATNSDLDPSVIISKFVMHHEVPDYLGIGDFGITPVRSVRTKRYCTPIKDGEYWALGLPVAITPNISDDSGIIEKYKIGSIIRSFDESDMIRSIEEIDLILKEDREATTERIRQIAFRYRSFDIADTIYESIYSPE